MVLTRHGRGLALGALVAALWTPLALRAQATPRASGTRVSLGLLADPAGTPARLVVKGVSPNGPAARAGLAVGDTIVRLDGREATLAALSETISGLKPGDRTTFLIRRDGAERPIALVVQELLPVPSRVVLHRDSVHARTGQILLAATCRDAAAPSSPSADSALAACRAAARTPLPLLLPSRAPGSAPTKAPGRASGSAPGSAPAGGEVLVPARAPTRAPTAAHPVPAPSGAAIPPRGLQPLRRWYDGWGARFEPVRADSLGRSPGGAAIIVTRVDAGSSAARAGLRAGDLVLQLGETRTPSLADVARAAAVGDLPTLQVSRAGTVVRLEPRRE